MNREKGNGNGGPPALKVTTYGGIVRARIQGSAIVKSTESYEIARQEMAEQMIASLTKLGFEVWDVEAELTEVKPS